MTDIPGQTALAAAHIDTIKIPTEPISTTHGRRTLTEAQFQQQVLDIAKTLGWKTYHTYDSRRSEAGFPDIVAVSARQGRTIYVELKTQTGRMSLAQKDWLRTLATAGNEVAVWRPADLEDVKAAFLGRRLSSFDIEVA